MSKQPTAKAPEEEPTSQEEPKDEFDEERARAKIAKANSEAANLRKRVKELEGYETRLKELEEADKSELEKANTKAADAERRVAAAEAKMLRYEIAAEKGLTLAQAKRLVGDSREELESDADELVEQFAGTEDGKKPPARKPTERLRSATDPEGPAETADQLFGALLRGEST